MQQVIPHDNTMFRFFPDTCVMTSKCDHDVPCYHLNVTSTPYRTETKTLTPAIVPIYERTADMLDTSTGQVLDSTPMLLPTIIPIYPFLMQLKAWFKVPGIIGLSSPPTSLASSPGLPSLLDGVPVVPTDSFGVFTSTTPIPTALPIPQLALPTALPTPQFAILWLAVVNQINVYATLASDYDHDNVPWYFVAGVIGADRWPI